MTDLVAVEAKTASAERPDASSPPPLVSVIVPACNAAWSIERTLASLTTQTLADFECVIVDDGSTDDTADRARASISGDPRFALVRQPNGGVAAARNRGLRLARGAYVANLDADDVWRPQFLARAVEALERAGAQATMAFARSIWIGPDDKALIATPEPLHRVDYRELLLRNPIGNGSAAVMRRDAVLACGGWDAELVRDHGQTEDWLLQLQLAAKGDVVVIDEPLVLYRISDSSASWNLERAGQGTLEVIRRAQASGPRLPRADYWAGRSIALLALMRRARQSGHRRLALRFVAHAYLRNPLWFREPELREPFVAAPRKAARVLSRVLRKSADATA